MDNKVRIGGNSVQVERATLAEKSAADAASDLTMMQRRVRTFYLAISEVSFPEDAPAWAPNWLEWLATGEVADPIVDPEPVLASEGDAILEGVAGEAAEDAAVDQAAEDQADAEAAQADLAAEAPIA